MLAYWAQEKKKKKIKKILYEKNNLCVSNCQPNYYIKVSDKKLKCAQGSPVQMKEKYIIHPQGNVLIFAPGEIYIKGDNNCSSSCESKDFYEKFNASGYDNYKYLSNCTGKEYIEGTKKCIDNFGDLIFYKR